MTFNSLLIRYIPITPVRTGRLRSSLSTFNSLLIRYGGYIPEFDDHMLRSFSLSILF